MLFTCPCCKRTGNKPELVPLVDLSNDRGVITYGNHIILAANRVVRLLKIIQERGPATTSQLALRLLSNPEATPLTHVYITQLRNVLRPLNIKVEQVEGRYELKLPQH